MNLIEVAFRISDLINHSKGKKREFLIRLLRDLQPHLRNPYFGAAEIERPLNKKTLESDLQAVDVYLSDEEKALFLISPVKVKPFRDIRENIKNEIKKTLQELPLENRGSEFLYINKLKPFLHIEKIAKSHEVKLPPFLEFKKKKKLAKHQLDLQEIYEATEKKYQGEIILTMDQGQDPRVGNMPGFCFGLTAAWLNGFIQGKNPLGVSPNHRAFKPVPAKTLEKYSDLNHIAIITPKIQMIQDSQSGNFEGMKYDVVKKAEFFRSSQEISATLIENFKRAPEKGYGLILAGHIGGHIIGIKKKGEYYHFMDSNGIWCRFKSLNNLKNWISFYLTKKNYEKKFSSYYLLSFEKSEDLNYKKKIDDSLIISRIFGWKFFLNNLINIAISNVKTSISIIKNTIRMFFPNFFSKKAKTKETIEKKEITEDLKKPSKPTYSKLVDALDISPPKLKSDSEKVKFLDDQHVIPAQKKRFKENAVEEPSQDSSHSSELNLKS